MKKVEPNEKNITLRMVVHVVTNAQQESVRRRLSLLTAVHVVTKRRRVCEGEFYIYIHKEMKIYCDRPICTSDECAWHIRETNLRCVQGYGI